MSKLRELIERVRETGVITPAEVLAVRRAVYGDDGAISIAEADEMFVLEAARKQHSREWSALYVEALTDCVLNRQPPAGYLSAANAEWVQQRLSRRKVPSTDCDIELVVNLIEQARQVPPSFSAFALRLVKEAVIYGDGTDKMGRELGSGRITDADLKFLSRILWGAGAEGLLAVSADEADALFAIADATHGADNAAGFADLFARAVGNFLIGATGRSVVDHETAHRWETEDVTARRIDVADRKLLQTKITPAVMLDTMRNVRTLSEDLEHTFDQQNQAREAAIAVAEVMTPEKAAWLLERVNRNGVMTAAEKALVQFIAREAGALDASTRDVIAKVA